MTSTSANPVRRLRGRQRFVKAFVPGRETTFVTVRARPRFEMLCPACGERYAPPNGLTRKQAKDAYRHHRSTCGATEDAAQDVA